MTGVFDFLSLWQILRAVWRPFGWWQLREIQLKFVSTGALQEWLQGYFWRRHYPGFVGPIDLYSRSKGPGNQKLRILLFAKILWRLRNCVDNLAKRLNFHEAFFLVDNFFQFGCPLNNLYWLWSVRAYWICSISTPWVAIFQRWLFAFN